jgi:hypothetical protein
MYRDEAEATRLRAAALEHERNELKHKLQEQEATLRKQAKLLALHYPTYKNPFSTDVYFGGCLLIYYVLIFLTAAICISR